MAAGVLDDAYQYSLTQGRHPAERGGIASAMLDGTRVLVRGIQKASARSS
jgi:hypothetical protein